MLLRTSDGRTISIVNTDKKSLFDNNGTEWTRCSSLDNSFTKTIGYKNSVNKTEFVMLTVEEMKRVINGAHAMLTPTTVEEMRVYTTNLPMEYQQIIDQWPDQKLREILIEAENKYQNPRVLLETKVYAIIRAREAVERTLEEKKQAKINGEATEKPEKTHPASNGYKNTPRQRKQEGSLSVAFGTTSITLTPKQLEFMERLSECPGWKETGTNGEYTASQYAEELSDTMNPMAMGAILTTLREKGILTTKKIQMGGVKCCVFKLTDAGTQIYNSLAGR